MELYLHWEDPATRSPRCRVVTDGLRLGSSEGLADVRITAPGLNSVHAELRLTADGSCVIAGMGSSRIVSNGETVSRCLVAPGSVVQLGSLTLRFASSASFAPPPAPPTRAQAVRVAVAARPSVAPRSSGIVIGALSATAVLVTAGAVTFFVTRSGSPRPAPPAAAQAKAKAAPRSLPAPKEVPSAAPLAGAGEKDLFSQARKSVVTVIAKHSFDKGFATGTGFFVDAQGRVVTNYHVVKQTDYQQILMPGNEEPTDARIISKDEESDLVLLQTYVTPPVPVAPMLRVSTDLRMGDTVYALGSPAGPELAVSLSRGIVSTDRPRTFGDKSFIQHDAAVNPGNSGGPLLNSRGEVVGVNTAKVKGAEGISFAIPIEDVRHFVEVGR